MNWGAYSTLALSARFVQARLGAFAESVLMVVRCGGEELRVVVVVVVVDLLAKLAREEGEGETNSYACLRSARARREGCK